MTAHFLEPSRTPGTCQDLINGHMNRWGRKSWDRACKGVCRCLGVRATYSVIKELALEGSLFLDMTGG